MVAVSVSASSGSHAKSGFGATDRGAIGGDFDRAPTAVPDFGAYATLKTPAKAELDDAHVVVVASQCSPDDAPTPGTCSASNSSDGGAPYSQSDDEDTSVCPSTWANEQLLDKPTAAKGFVCVYVLGGTNFGTIIGGDAIHGVSIAPGDLGSKLGFKIAWGPDNSGDSYVDAIWAYDRG